MEDLGINNVWNGKRVLVTGHTGFKGTWLVFWLLKHGAKIAGYSLREYPNDLLYKSTTLSTQIIDTRGDICDSKSVDDLFATFKPDIVFHLAAQPLVRQGYSDPLGTFTTNVNGTLNILESIRKHRTPCAVIVTSDKCYENREVLEGYTEECPLSGRDPYSCSKSCQELIVDSYRKSFFRNLGILVATARAGNVIGGGDYAQDRLIPDCVQALKKNSPITLRSPNAVRPWQHVLEPLSGYLLLGKKLLLKEHIDEPWNFGPNIDSIKPVREVVELFIETWGDGKWMDTSSSNQPHEAQFLNLNISKAQKRLGWHPKLSLQEAMSYTVDAYQSEHIEETIRNQIDAYEQK